MIEFVQAVANDPEKALKNAGIIVRPLTLEELPNQHRFFSQDRYEDFFASIVWVEDVAPREHDATCFALTMRLRAGQHSSDLFRCRYVFVTRNPRFVRDARAYCLQSRLITEVQESPVIHQRELATITWLRTGLGASEAVPRSHLLATCDRVLSLRTEVRNAVGQKLKALTPEKIEQYELLLLDQKSVRRLADQTLNDESVITEENAEQLLEAMRRATAEDERVQFEQKLKAVKADSTQKLKNERALVAQAQAVATKVTQERDAAIAKLHELRRSRICAIETVADSTNRSVRRIDRLATSIVLVVAGLSTSNYVFQWFASYRISSIVIGGILALFGAYHSLMNAFERPKIGVPTLMNWLARKIFVARLTRAGLVNDLNLGRVQFERGRVSVANAIPTELPNSIDPDASDSVLKESNSQHLSK